MSTVLDKDELRADRGAYSLCMIVSILNTIQGQYAVGISRQKTSDRDDTGTKSAFRFFYHAEGFVINTTQKSTIELYQLYSSLQNIKQSLSKQYPFVVFRLSSSFTQDPLANLHIKAFKWSSYLKPSYIHQDYT